MGWVVHAAAGRRVEVCQSVWQNVAGNKEVHSGRPVPKPTRVRAAHAEQELAPVISIAPRKLGELSCQVGGLSGDVDPPMVCILCHGFGAPATDLVPLAPELLQVEPRLTDACGFVFPAAPLSLEAQGMPGGRAWWPLDMQRLNAALMSGQLRDLRQDIPDGLDDARRMLLGLIEELLAVSGLTHQQLVLGGFSQGAMLATDVALHLPEPVAGLCLLSGTLLAESIWSARLDNDWSIPVFQSHGFQDPILPFSGAEALRDLLGQSGFPVEFIPFAGQHTIPADVLRRLASWLWERRESSPGPG